MLSANIKYLRTKNGLSQTVFGKLFKASRGMIDTYERAVAQPSHEFVKAVASHYKLTIDALTNKDLSKEGNINSSTENDLLKLKDDLIAALQSQIKSQEFIKEIRCLRSHLEPVLNHRLKAVLIEAERRLTGGELLPPDNFKKEKEK